MGPEDIQNRRILKAIIKITNLLEINRLETPGRRRNIRFLKLNLLVDKILVTRKIQKFSLCERIAMKVIKS